MACYLADDAQLVGTKLLSLFAAQHLGHVAHAFGQAVLVFRGNGDDMIDGQVAQHARLYLNLLRIGVPFHLVARLEFGQGHHAHFLKHRHALFLQIGIEDERTTGLAVQAAAQGFGLPLFAVAIALKADGLALADIAAQHTEDGLLQLVALAQERVHVGLEVAKLLCHSRIEHNHSRGRIGLAAHGTKLKAVAREGEGRRAVAVGIVNLDFGNLGERQAQPLLRSTIYKAIVRTIFDSIEHTGKFLAQETGDDGGRCFVGAEAVGIGGAHDGSLEQAVVMVNRHQRIDDKGEVAQLVVGCLARREEQGALVRAERPVAVLAAAVDTLEGLFVEEHAETVFGGHFAHERHENHVVVNGQVALLVDGSQFKLCGGYFVVTCFDGDAELDGADLQVLHKLHDATGDATEIMVLKLLVAGGLVAHQRSAGE